MKLYASMSVQYSRGCPYDCEFCNIVNLNGRRPRVKSNEQMIREFEILYEMGWRGSVFVVDDNFIGNQSKVKSLPEGDQTVAGGQRIFLSRYSLKLR